VPFCRVQLLAAAADVAAGGVRTLPGPGRGEAYSYAHRVVPFYCR